MKKTILAMTILCFIATTTQAANAISLPSYSFAKEWMKSKTQTWPGMYEGKTYWYKLDSNAKLWWSMNGKKWGAVDSQTWADKSGKWLKIHEGKLVWSMDGSLWSEVPEWKWEGSDGKWYKFDAMWKLWVK